MRQRRGHSKTKRRAWAYAATSAAAVFAGASVCAAQEVTSYWSGVTGSWTDPTQWSTDPNYPNNGTPSGTTYDAVINAPGTAPYTVSLDTNITTDSVTMDSPNALLTQTGGTLTTPVLNILAGTYALGGAVLQNTTLTSSNTATVAILNSVIANSTIDLSHTTQFGFVHLVNDTLDCDITTTDTTYIDGINAQGHTINAFGHGDPSSGWLLVDSPTGSSATLSNITVNLGGSPTNFLRGGFLYLNNLSNTDALTLDGTTTVEGWGAVGGLNPPFGQVDPVLINQGTITANVSGQTLAIPSTALTNTGTLQAFDGGILSITTGSVSWTNNGTLAVDSTSMININQGRFGDTVFASGSAFDTVLGSNGASGIIAITGNLEFQSGVSLNLSMVAGTVFSGPYEIASYTGTLTGSFAEVTPGYTLSYSQPGEILVTADPPLTSPLPEPSGGLLCASLCFLLARCRKGNETGTQLDRQDYETSRKA